jgi:prevent-host-death family protein
MITTVGSRELKNRLGAYLKRVKRGETLQVTERGEPIAEIRPLKPMDGSLEARLERLAAEGKITLPKRKGFRPFPRLNVKEGTPSLSQAVIEDREDRF